MAPTKVGVIGAGALGTALAIGAANRGAQTLLWDPDEDLCKKLDQQGENPRDLPGVRLPKNLECTHDLERACKGAPLLLLNLDCDKARDVVRRMGDHVTGDQSLIHTASGFMGQANGILRMSEIVRGGCCIKKVGALSLPMSPKELLDEQPGAAVVASGFSEVWQLSRKLFSTPYLQIYHNADLVGVEVGMALSQVYGIVAAIGEGLGFGTGTKALVGVRALAETAHFGVSLGARPAVFSGLSGVGALFCALCGTDSPGFTYGRALVDGGKDRADVPSENEFIRTLRAAVAYARDRRIAMPLLMGLHDVMEGKGTIESTIKKLIAMEAGREADFTIDHTQERLPLVKLSPRGGEGKDS
jgi:glycerol-3-phosphate dehydrogenase (NAD(P)+)